MIYRKVHLRGKLAGNDRSHRGQCRNISQQSLRQIPNSHTSHPRLLKIQSDPKTRRADRLVSLARIFDALHRSRSLRAWACVSQFDRFTERHRACVHARTCMRARRCRRRHDYNDDDTTEPRRWWWWKATCQTVRQLAAYNSATRVHGPFCNHWYANTMQRLVPAPHLTLSRRNALRLGYLITL